ncbi:hypothetical protein LZ32DRAFT_608897 [Colletotrichum eremochloae]|nr:hypothetical protein LZ32DRAFT_608897 [Colletotrichum eremochloae]
MLLHHPKPQCRRQDAGAQHSLRVGEQQATVILRRGVFVFLLGFFFESKLALVLACWLPRAEEHRQYFIRTLMVGREQGPGWCQGPGTER